MKKEKNIILIITIVYFLLLTLYLSKFDFNPSATIQVSENYSRWFNHTLPDKVIKFNNTGFDGQLYYFMALGPSFNNFNISPHYFQRPLYPFLSLILSFGIECLIPVILILINLASIILCNFFLLKILENTSQAKARLIWIFAFNVGFIICLLKDLSEPLMILFILLMFYYAKKGRHILASFFLALALLSRELTLTIWLATILFFLIKKDFKKAGLYFLAIIPFTIWQIILFYQFGLFPLSISSYSASSSGIVSYLSAQPFSFWDILHFKGNLFSILQQINKSFAALPIILFALINLIIIILDFIKEKKITLSMLLLLSQISLIFLLSKNLLLDTGIDAIGRYSLGLFLFSIIYLSKKPKYPLLLSIISLSLSVAYFAIMIFIK